MRLCVYGCWNRFGNSIDQTPTPARHLTLYAVHFTRTLSCFVELDNIREHFNEPNMHGKYTHSALSLLVDNRQEHHTEEHHIHGIVRRFKYSSISVLYIYIREFTYFTCIQCSYDSGRDDERHSQGSPQTFCHSPAREILPTSY